MGNGFDTVFLAELVGAKGCVFAFDVQEEARLVTRQQLEERNLTNVETVLDCHSRMEKHLPIDIAQKVSAVVFNLGYLPRGDKSVITAPNTTTAAIKAGWRLLSAGGLISVLAYVGHEGGLEESKAVDELIDILPQREWLRRDDLDLQTLSPRLFVARKRPPA